MARNDVRMYVCANLQSAGSVGTNVRDMSLKHPVKLVRDVVEELSDEGLVKLNKVTDNVVWIGRKDSPKDGMGKEIDIADKKNVTNIEQTSQNLVGILFDEIEQLRDGKTDTDRAKAVSSLAAQIIGTAKVEMEYRKLLKDE